MSPQMESEPPFHLVPARAPASPFVVTCDHASNRIPERYQNLGLPSDALSRHIAYDIGADEVARKMAAALNAPAVLGGFSRLLIDPNRGEDDPTLVMKLSDRAIVPANRTVDPFNDVGEWQRRLDEFYRPYHQAIADTLSDTAVHGHVPVIVSVHSFTPAWHGRPRPWQIGLLWDMDDRLAAPLLQRLQAEPDLTVGDNLPYSGSLKGDCLYRHGTSNGYPHILIEIRQDLIADTKGQDHWAAFLAAILLEVTRRPDVAASLERIRFFGSHADE